MNTIPLFKEGLPMSEDCLFLNIYAPATREEALAVMIWIHGGGGEGGGGGGCFLSR